MSDEKNHRAEGPWPKPPTRPKIRTRLKTAGDIRRALSELHQSVKLGKTPVEQAYAEVKVLMALHECLVDRRDHLWTSRLKQLWDAAQRQGAIPVLAAREKTDEELDDAEEDAEVMAVVDDAPDRERGL